MLLGFKPDNNLYFKSRCPLLRNTLDARRGLSWLPLPIAIRTSLWGVGSNGFSIYGSRNDTITPHSHFFFHLMASLAQMERELIAERTKSGLDAARKRGRVVGRNRRMTPGKIESAKQLLDAGMRSREVAKNLGVSIPTLYRWAPASSR